MAAAPPPRDGGSSRARTCAGCTYYSRALADAGKPPICVGVPRTVDGEVEGARLPPDVAAGGPFSATCIGYAAWPLEEEGRGGVGGRDRAPDDATIPQCLGVQIVRAQAVSASPALVGSGDGGPAPPRDESRPRPGRASAADGSFPQPPSLDGLLDRWEKSAAKVAARMVDNAAAAADLLLGRGGKGG